MIRVIKYRAPMELNAKYVPLPLEMDCPVCGKTIEAYDIDYPTVNGINKIPFYCEHDDTDFEDEEDFEHEAEVKLKLQCQVLSK